MSQRNFEKTNKKILPVFITICLLLMFELLCIMYLSFNYNLAVMNNTTHMEKCLEFDAATYILTFTKRLL